MLPKKKSYFIWDYGLYYYEVQRQCRYAWKTQAEIITASCASCYSTPFQKQHFHMCIYIARLSILFAVSPHRLPCSTCTYSGANLGSKLTNCKDRFTTVPVAKSFTEVIYLYWISSTLLYLPTLKYFSRILQISCFLVLMWGVLYVCIQ